MVVVDVEVWETTVVDVDVAGGEVTTKDTSLVADVYEPVAAAVARTVQVPVDVNVRTPLLELTEHPVVPALVTEYVIVPLPDVVARADGVAGESDVVSDVVGAQDTVCGCNVPGAKVT